MTHRNRAAIHVDLVVGDVQHIHEAQDDRGERLVQLPELEVFLFHPGLGERPFGGGARAGQHNCWLRTDGSEALDARAGL
jgi:hypothetical protein